MAAVFSDQLNHTMIHLETWKWAEPRLCEEVILVWTQVWIGEKVP